MPTRHRVTITNTKRERVTRGPLTRVHIKKRRSRGHVLGNVSRMHAREKRSDMRSRCATGRLLWWMAAVIDVRGRICGQARGPASTGWIRCRRAQQAAPLRRRGGRGATDNATCVRSLVVLEAEAALRFDRGVHQLADGLEDLFELGVVFAFEVVEPHGWATGRSPLRRDQRCRRGVIHHARSHARRGRLGWARSIAPLRQQSARDSLGSQIATLERATSRSPLYEWCNARCTIHQGRFAIVRLLRP